jgi:hypothetical protein
MNVSIILNPSGHFSVRMKRRELKILHLCPGGPEPHGHRKRKANAPPTTTLRWPSATADVL